MSDDNYVLDILLSEDNDYMGTGFSRKQYLALKDLIDQYRHPQRSSAPLAAPPQTSPPAQPAAAALPADPPAAPPPAPPQTSPPAQKPCAQTTTPELPPQPIPTPVPTPAPTRSFPPSPSVETIEEVEEKQVYKIPLRNVKKMRQKHRHGAAKKMPRTRVSKFFENCIGLPSKFGAVNMCFSRDEDPDAWYTTMLNHKQKIGAIPNWI